MATLEEIAEAAGVTPMTVSNILNGRNKENWPSTVRRAQRIRELAQQMNYRPNAAAKAIATGRTGALGLLSSSDPSSGNLFASTLRTIRRELALRDMHLTMGDLDDEKLTNTAFVPKVLRELAADGLLISYIASIPPRLIELIQQHQIPSIWMNTKLPNDSVYPDDQAAAEQATEHLLKMGHTSVAYVHPLTSGHYSVAERKAGYLKAMKRARLKPQIVETQRRYTGEDWMGDSCSWLGNSERPTAVLTYEFKDALPAFCAAMSLGLKVPQDISFLTFHEEEASALGLPITTMLVPCETLGHHAIEMALCKIQAPEIAIPSQAIPFSLASGQTCAAPQRNC